MRVGLIGLPFSGKTTLFQLLTQHAPATTARGASLAVGRVPDQRLDRLTEIQKPRRTVPTRMEFVDLPGWVPEGSESERQKARWLQNLQDVDLLVHVVRGFDAPEAPHVQGSIDPVRDAQTLLDELLLADWGLVETRIGNIRDARKKPAGYEEELRLLERFRGALEKGTPLGALTLDRKEEERIKGYVFYTRKPMVVALNLDEDALPDKDHPYRTALEAWCRGHDTALVVTSAKVEAEIEALSPEDRREFLDALQVEEPGLARLARTAYAHLGLISYFTVGETEVRAWTVRQGSTAPEAGRAIHSDISRGFIRAEVVAYDDFVEAGSMAAARAAGRVRLEGKEYVVQDGDIVHFRFNV